MRKKRIEEERIRQNKETARLAEDKRQAELKQAKKAKKDAELARQKAEQKAKQLAAKLKAQEEAQKKAEAEAEQRRLQAVLDQEEAEMKALEERKLKEQQARLREQEEKARQAARERQLQSMLLQYIGAITAKVQGRWRKPIGANSDKFSCYVYVLQNPSGFIQQVKVLQCRGGDEQLKRSVEEAVWKSDPLPIPADAALFDRELKFKFEPQ